MAPAILALALLAQQPPPPVPSPKQRPMDRPVRQQPPPTPPDQLASLQGRAISARTGEPIRKAAITLNGGPQEGARRGYTATTDAEGNFRIAAVEPGRYTIFAERTGFVRQNYTRAPIVLDKAQKVTGVLVKLVPQGVITGKVLDEEGDVVAFATVQVNRIRAAGGQRQMTQINSVQTNDIGEFRLANLTPGRYYLSAMARNIGFRAGPMAPSWADQPVAQEAYTTVFYPGTLDPSGAAPIDIQAGAELRGMDLRLMKQRVFRVRGVVQGVGVANLGRRPVMVSLNVRSTEGWQGERRQSTTRPPGNEFEIRNVPPGSYVLSAQTMEGQQLNYARVPVEIGNGDLDNVALMLQPAFQLSGTYKVEGADAPAAEGNVRVLLRAAEPMRGVPMGPGGGGQIKTGAFQVGNLVAEKYQVSLGGLPDGAYLKSARLGDRDALEHGVDLTNGSPGAMLNVVASMDGGQISGTVTNEKGEPVPGATVTLMPSASRARQQHLYKRVTAEQSGAFTIRGIAPGDYRVFAWEEVDQLSWQDPEYVKPYENSAKSVSIREKGMETLQLRAIPGETGSQ